MHFKIMFFIYLNNRGIKVTMTKMEGVTEILILLVGVHFCHTLSAPSILVL